MYTLHIQYKNFVTVYDALEIQNIIDLGDSYNIVSEDNLDIYISKKYCSVNDHGLTYDDGELCLVIEG